MMIFSAYNYSSTIKDADLLSTYLSFHWSYYFSIVFTFLFFTAACIFCSLPASQVSKKVKQEIAHARKPSWWITKYAILDQDQYPNMSRVYFTILSLCFSAFFYLLIDCFMPNIISTDLVVIEHPRVIRDYHDIVDRDGGGRLKVLFHRGGTEETSSNTPQRAHLKLRCGSVGFFVGAIFPLEWIGDIAEQ